MTIASSFHNRAMPGGRREQGKGERAEGQAQKQPGEGMRPSVEIRPCEAAMASEELIGFASRCCERAWAIRPPDEKAVGEMRLAQDMDPAALAMAFVNGAPEGLCAVGLPRSPGKATLRFLGVVPQGRGQGIGRMLERHAVQLAKSRGVEEIQTPGIDSRNLGGLAFLDRLGWTPRPDAGIRMLRDLEGLPAVNLPEGYAIRSFRDGDAEHLMRIKNAAFAGEATGSRAWTPADVQREYMDSPHFRPERVFLAIHGEEPVGTTAAWVWTHEGREVGLIHWVAVVPEHRGKGLGEALNVHALQYMRARGHREAILNTNAALHSAVRLYHRLGFRDVWRNVVHFKRL